jgi:hypothetical protein
MMKNGHLMLQMFGGNQGDGANYKWTPANPNLMVRRGLPGQVGAGDATARVPVAPSDAIRNVPPAGSTMPGMTSAGIGGGGGGPVAIHINGGSQDPESLAALVQKRMEEAIQWRSHDVDSVMT